MITGIYTLSNTNLIAENTNHINIIGTETFNQCHAKCPFSDFLVIKFVLSHGYIRKNAIKYIRYKPNKYDIKYGYDSSDIIENIGCDIIIIKAI